VILRLVRQQLRSQWRYTAWSAGLLAFAVALGTYAMVTGATALGFPFNSDSFSQKANAAAFGSVFSTDGVPVEDPKIIGLHNIVPFDEVEAMIAQASSETSVDASVSVVGWVDGNNDGIEIVAITPSIAWDGRLASGRPPGHGEIAIYEQTASEFGVGVGDTITLNADDTQGARPSMTFVISGILRSGDAAPYWHVNPWVAYASWSDAREIALGLTGYLQTDQATGEPTRVVQTIVAWDGNSGTLAPYADKTPWRAPDQNFNFLGAVGNTGFVGFLSLAAACVAVLGMMIAAFGMGRAQAEARTKWAATARVLGATRRTVAVSSLLETAIVSLAGIALGLGAGIAAVAARLAWLRASHPEALLPSGPSVPASLVLAGAAMGLVIAAAVAAVPAFWASRVAPVAALKPVTPIGEATVSRNVSLRWPVGIFAGGVLARSALFWISERANRTDTDVITVLEWITGAVVAVSAGALVVEGSRTLVRRVGTVLSRSRRPWLIAAGDGLSAHRRIFTFASLAMFAAAAAFTGAATANAEAHDYAAGHIGRGDPPLPSFSQWWDVELPGALLAGALAWVAGIITVVAVVVTVSSRATFAGDAATRSALGLSANGERVASAARQWAVMGAASISGAVLGWLIPLVLHLVRAALSPNRLVYSWHWNVTVALWGLAATGVVIAIALAVSLVGSLVVGLLARPRTPVEALRRAEGVRS
jgi:hypothetical protein